MAEVGAAILRPNDYGHDDILRRVNCYYKLVMKFFSTRERSG